MLLKIYCENIVITFLNCIFPLFLSTRPYVSFFFFFFFFSLDFSPPYTCTLISTLSFFFLCFLVSTSFQNLPLSFFLQLSFSTFFFLLDSKWRKRQKEKEQMGQMALLRHAFALLSVPPRLLLCHYCLSSSQRSPNGRQLVSFFSFFSFYCNGLINFKIMFLSCILIMLEFLEMFERKNCYEFFFSLF